MICPTCSSKHVRIEGYRFQCGDCGYDQPHDMICPICGGGNLVIHDDIWRCKICHPKKSQLKKEKIMRQQAFSQGQQS